MKKLMIALGAVAFAAVSQAATVSWQQNTTQIDGDWSTGSGNIAPEGWTMYLFDSNGSGTSYSQMQTLLASAASSESGYDNWLNAMDSAVAAGTINSDGQITVDGIDMTAVSKSFTGYGILVDNSEFGDADYAFLIGEQSWTQLDTVTTVSLGEDFSVGGGNFVNALDYSTKSNWSEVGYAAPEPTSGLLLLLGMSALALRRRRA